MDIKTNHQSITIIVLQQGRVTECVVQKESITKAEPTVPHLPCRGAPYDPIMVVGAAYPNLEDSKEVRNLGSAKN